MINKFKFFALYLTFIKMRIKKVDNLGEIL